MSFLRKMVFLLIFRKGHDNVCSINGIVCLNRKLWTLNHGPFFLLLLLWSSIVISIFNICHKFILALSHFMYLLLALSLIWKALPKSQGFFWLRTVLWIMCSRRFPCITDYFFFGCNSEKCSWRWWELTFSPICLSLKCSKKCFCWVVDSILPLSSGLKKRQLPKITLVTCRQGISDAGASCSILFDRLLYTEAGVENCLG